MSSSNLQNKAYREIKNKIICADYEPGRAISAQEISLDINIGRTPVRESIIRLERENLIDVIPQSGSFISKINIHSTENARFVRESIEVLVCLEACQLISKSDIADLQENIELQKFYAKFNKQQNFFELDDAFHEFFYKIVGKHDVWRWLETITTPLNRFRLLRLKVNELEWTDLIEQHQAILNAIVNNQPAILEAEVNHHLNRMIEEKELLITTFPTFFE